MKHARADYDRIQDPDNKIPEKEPVFLLRGQDKAAPAALRAYAEANKLAGGDYELTMMAYNQADKMDDWQEFVKSKVADL